MQGKNASPATRGGGRRGRGKAASAGGGRGASSGPNPTTDGPDSAGRGSKAASSRGRGGSRGGRGGGGKSAKKKADDDSDSNLSDSDADGDSNVDSGEAEDSVPSFEDRKLRPFAPPQMGLQEAFSQMRQMPNPTGPPSSLGTLGMHAATLNPLQLNMPNATFLPSKKADNEVSKAVAKEQAELMAGSTGALAAGGAEELSSGGSEGDKESEQDLAQTTEQAPEEHARRADKDEDAELGEREGGGNASTDDQFEACEDASVTKSGQSVSVTGEEASGAMHKDGTDRGQEEEGDEAQQPSDDKTDCEGEPAR